MTIKNTHVSNYFFTVFQNLRSSKTFYLMSQKFSKQILLCMLIIIVSSVFGLLSINYQAKFVANLQGNKGDFVTVLKPFILFFLTQLVFETTLFARRYIQVSLTTGSTDFLKTLIFEKLFKLSPASGFANQNSKFIQTFTSDATQAASIWSEGILSFFLTIIMTTIVSLFLIYEIGFIGSVFFICLFILVFMAIRYSKIIAPEIQKRSVASEARLAELSEAIKSAPTIKTLNLQEKFLHQVNQKLEVEEKSRLIATEISTRYIPIFASLRWIAWVLIVASVLFLEKQKTSTLEGSMWAVNLIFSVNWISALLQEFYVMIGSYLSFVQFGLVSISRIDVFLAGDETASVDEFQTNLADTNSRSTIVEFKDAEFSFELAKPAFLKCSFSIHPKERIAIIGKLGSGKSSLFKAILGELHSTGGAVLKKNLLKISYLPQEIFIHSSTIRDAIRLQFDNAITDDTKILSLLEFFEFEKDIAKFKDGLNTKIGERGMTLSGGQKQRLSLARTLFFDDSDLFLLDDPFSSLDATTATKISESLMTFLERKLPQSAFLISCQNLRIASKFPIIWVLDKGNIVATGTHESLLKACEIYKELWNEETNENQGS